MSELLSPRKVWSRAEVLASPCPVPRSAGVYAWYFREVPEGAPLPSACRWDARTRSYRAPALSYADVVRCLRRLELDYDDRARGYAELSSRLTLHREPRPFQSEALSAFRKAQGRGLAGFLIERSLDALARAGYPTLFLAVTEGNAPAQRLYDRLGFRRVGPA